MAATKDIRSHFLIILILISYFVIGYVNTFDSQQETFLDNGKKALSCHWCGLTMRQKIIGGRDAKVHDFPWTVTIRYWEVNICGGTIINSHYVITAAHCIKGKILALLKVAATTVDILNTRQIAFAVADTIVHDRFDPNTYDYDIGLVRIARSMKFGRLGLRPICLPESDDANQNLTAKLATVVGWGVVKQDETSPQGAAKLHRVTVPIVDNDVCRNASGLKDYLVTSRMMCAGYIVGGKDACQGDSGGPMMIKEEIGAFWKQVGIISWGVGCGQPNYFGVYTRISYFINWLTANMWDRTC